MKIKINGQSINSNTIRGFATRKQNALADLGTFANAAAAQAVLNGNKDWLTALTDACKLKSGKLDKMGQLAVAYIKHNTGGLQFTAKDGWKMAEEKSGKRTIKANTDGQTFAMTLAEFQNYKKPVDPPAVKPATGAAILSRIAGLTATLQNGLKVTDAEQAEQIRQGALALLAELEKATTKAAAAAGTVDTDKAEQSASIKATSKEKAAPKVKAVK